MAGGAFRLRFDRSISLIDLDSWEPRGDVAALPCQSASVPMPHCVDLRSLSSSSEHLAEQVPGSRQCFASLVPSGSLQCIDLSSDTSNSAWQLAESPFPGRRHFVVLLFQVTNRFLPSCHCLQMHRRSHGSRSNLFHRPNCKHLIHMDACRAPQVLSIWILMSLMSLLHG